MGKGEGKEVEELGIGIREALLARLKGNHVAYTTLMERLSVVQECPPLVVFKAAANSASLLASHSRRFSDLIRFLVAPPGVVLHPTVRGSSAEKKSGAKEAMSQELQDEHLSFLLHLVSANTSLLPLVFGMLAMAMTPRSREELDRWVPWAKPLLDDNKHSGGEGSGGGRDGGEEEEEEEEEEEGGEEGRTKELSVAADIPDLALFRCFDMLLRLVPTGVSALMDALGHAIPHKSRSLASHAGYVLLLLRLMRRMPAIEDRLFLMLVERVVTLDADIRLDEAGTGDRAEEEDESDEGGGEKGEKEEGGGSGEEEKDDALDTLKSQRTTEVAEKLDVILQSMFQYLDERCGAVAPGVKGVESEDAHPLRASSSTSTTASTSASSSLMDRRRQHMFALVLEAFDRCVLCTYEAKFTQFLVFYTCRLDASLCDAFVGRLINHVRDASAPTETRVSATAYLGSFLSRARFVKLSVVYSALFFVMRWLHAVVDTRSALLREGRKESDAMSRADSEGGASVDLSAVPDAASEGVISVFCAAFQAISYTVCFHAKALAAKNTSVDFLRALEWSHLISSPLQPLRYIAPHVAEEFQRVALKLQLCAAEEFTLPASSTPPPPFVQTFFPFDPCLLRRSKRFLRGLYRHWGDDSLPESDDEEEEEEAEGVEGVTGGREEELRRERTSSILDPRALPEDVFGEEMGRSVAVSIGGGGAELLGARLSIDEDKEYTAAIEDRREVMGTYDAETGTRKPSGTVLGDEDEDEDDDDGAADFSAFADLLQQRPTAPSSDLAHTIHALGLDSSSARRRRQSLSGLPAPTEHDDEEEEEEEEESGDEDGEEEEDEDMGGGVNGEIGTKRRGRSLHGTGKRRRK